MARGLTPGRRPRLAPTAGGDAVPIPRWLRWRRTWAVCAARLCPSNARWVRIDPPTARHGTGLAARRDRARIHPPCAVAAAHVESRGLGARLPSLLRGRGRPPFVSVRVSPAPPSPAHGCGPGALIGYLAHQGPSPARGCGRPCFPERPDSAMTWRMVARAAVSDGAALGFAATHPPPDTSRASPRDGWPRNATPPASTIPARGCGHLSSRRGPDSVITWRMRVSAPLWAMVRRRGGSLRQTGPLGVPL